MNKKMQYLVEHSLKQKFKSKSFVISNIIIFLALVLLINIDTIIKFFGGDFGNDINIYIVDTTDYDVYSEYEKVMNNSFYSILETNDYKLIKTEKTVEELKQEIIDEEKEDIIIYIEPDENLFKASIISYEFIETTTYQGMMNALNVSKYNIALSKSDIDEDELNKITSEVVIDRLILKEGVNEEEEAIKTVTQILVPVFILPFFMLILLVVSMIGAEINEEKSSRSMEIIISSVSPKIHFASKIISVNLFVLAQSLLLIVYAFLAALSRFIISGVPDMSAVDVSAVSENVNIDYVQLFLNSEVFKGIVRSIPFILILFLLSFIAFSLFAGILASMTTNIEDYQQLQTPLSFIMIAGYYIAIFAAMYESSVFIKSMSYIPLMSAVIAPALVLLGQYTIYDMCISIGLLIILIFLFIRYGSRIYKVGILNYDSNKLWRRMFSAMRQK